MLKWIKAKLAAMRNWNDAEEFRRGFDYAAGALLRGDASVADMIAETNLFSFKPYDRGMLDACKTYKQITAEGAP